MKHDPIELPPGGDLSEFNRLPEDQPATGGEICAEWLRVFGAPSPIAPGRKEPISAAILAEAQQLREHHVAKGHTPESDARHNEGYFLEVFNEFMRRARVAKTAKTRRKNLMIALGVVVAMIDAEDFRRSQLTGGNLEHDP